MDEREFQEKLEEALPMARIMVGQLLQRRLSDVDDVLALTINKAWTARDSFEGRSKFSTWLCRIAKNEAFMLLRRENAKTKIRSGSCVPLSEAWGQPSGQPSPEDRVLRQERWKQFREALRRLSAIRRQEILRFLTSERGDPLNTSNLLKSRRHWAVQDLKRMMKWR